MESNLPQTKTPTVCRTCLTVIEDGCEFSISDSNSTESSNVKTAGTFREKLLVFLPEINLKITHHAVICISCAAAVESAYKFRKKCLKSEERIRNFAAKMNCTSNFDLRHFLQTDNINIKVEDGEVEEEVETEQLDITLFDVFKQECLISRQIEEVNCIAMYENLKREQQQSFETIHISSVSFDEDSCTIAEDNDSTHGTKEQEAQNWQSNKLKTYECSNDSREGEDGEYIKASSKLPLNQISTDGADKIVNNPKALIDTSEKPFKCAECMFRARLKGNLKAHMLRMHAKNEKRKQFQCIMCDYKTAIKHHLTNHVRTHTGEKPFKCTECGYSTSQSTHLNTHMRIHSGDKPHKCTICDYSCTQKSHLRVHIRNHSGIRPYKCNVCTYCGTTKSSLSIHMRTHTGEKPYECPQCDYRAAQQSSLQSHIKLHNSANYLYNCNECSYKTVYRNGLVIHMKTHKKLSS